MQLGDRTYKNHLDGYNQMDLLTGKGPSKRNELFYFGGAPWARFAIDDIKFTFFQQPLGWPGEKVTTDMPGPGQSSPGPVRADAESPRRDAEHWRVRATCNDFFAREFWRFVLVQQDVAKLAETAVDYPPMQDPASFNLEAVKRKVEEMIKNRPGQ